MKKIHLLRLVIASLCFVSIPLTSSAQLNVTLGSQHTGWTPDSLVRNVLLGSGVEISNVQLNGSSSSINCSGVGTFTTGVNSTGIGISEGIILSACAANYIAGSSSGSSTHNCPTVTDPQLQNIAGANSVNNCSVLEFDFVPKSDSIRFRYVFASEEYQSYTCSQFNDVFAFFLTGVNPAGGLYTNTNIAIIPGTSLPVTINNVNSGTPSGSYPASNCNLNYSQYFNNNFNHSLITHMTGATTVLTAEARVAPCQLYHLKMAIANVSDGALPSVVFLEANSLSSNAIEFEFTNAANEEASSDLYEGCVASVRLSRPQAKYQATSVTVAYSGTATNGVDFTMINPVISFPAGQNEILLTVAPAMDGVAEGTETAMFVFSPSDGCPGADTVEFSILDTDPLVATITRDTITSGTATLWLHAHIEGGMPNRTVKWHKLSEPSQIRDGDSIFVSTAPDATWVVVVEDFCGNVSTDTMLIGRRMDFNYLLRDYYGTDRLGVLRITDTIICDQDTLRLYSHGADSCVWYSSLNSTPFELRDSVVTLLPHQRTWYYVRSYKWWNNQWWEDLDSMMVEVVPLPSISLNASRERICQGSSTTLTASGAANYSWDGGTTFGTSSSLTVTPDTTTVYRVLGLTNGAECYGRDTVRIVVDTMPIITISDPTGVCGGEMVELEVQTVAESFTWSAQPADPSLGGQEFNSHIMVNPASTTVYTVGAITGVCYSSVSTTVAVEPMPIAMGSVTPLTVSLGSMEATFIDNSQNATTRLWELPYGETSTAKELKYMVPDDVDSLTVRLWAYNPYQCFDTTTVTVYVDHTTLWTPNAFTPEESTNRTFDVKVNDVQRYHILIYDRRGQLVFESYDPENPWNGIAQNGKKCPQGVYSFIISCHKITHPFEQIIQRGTVLLIR